MIVTVGEMINCVVLFITHFIADFLLQSRKMGKKKSEDIKELVLHGFIIFWSFLLVTVSIFNWNIYFSLVYAIIHCLQDWYIWGGYKWLVKWRIAKKYFGGDMKSTWMELTGLLARYR